MTNFFNRKNKVELGAILSSLEADKTSNFYQDLERDPEGLFKLTDHALKATLQKLAAEERAQNAYYAQLKADLDHSLDVPDQVVMELAFEKINNPARTHKPSPNGSRVKHLDQKTKPHEKTSLLAYMDKSPFGLAGAGEAFNPEPVKKAFQWDESLKDDLRDLFEALEKVLEKMGRF
jgi:hypothetical protein